MIKDAELRALCRNVRNASDRLYDLQQQVIKAKAELEIAAQAVRDYRHRDPTSIAGKVTDELMKQVATVVGEKGPVAPSQIARMTGIPLPVVREALRRLLKKERVECRQTIGRRTVYAVREHERAAVAS